TKASALDLFDQSNGRPKTYFDAENQTWTVIQTCHTFKNNFSTRLLSWFIYNRIYKVDIEWHIGRTYSLQEIKNRLYEYMLSRNRFLKIVDILIPPSSIFGGHDLHPHEVFRKIVEHCRSFDEVIKILDAWMTPVTPEDMRDMTDFKGI
ncbi:MAG: hypothetical protein ABW174_00120, partial [Flavitalea sp.]